MLASKVGVVGFCLLYTSGVLGKVINKMSYTIPVRGLLRKARLMAGPAAGLLARAAHRIDSNLNISYSQEGEDMVLSRLLENRQTGFYIDVGALHPVRFSNTFSFYNKGWRGINIEPSPSAVKEFQRLRERDVNLELGVGEESGALNYYMFNEPALNTFDEKLMRDREAQPRFWVVGTTRVAVERLDAILDRHLPDGQVIDFLSVDVEGFDLQVLRSNDWSRFRPEFVLVEALDFHLEMARQHPIHIHLNSKGYHLVAKTVNTLFYHKVK